MSYSFPVTGFGTANNYFAARNVLSALKRFVYLVFCASRLGKDGGLEFGISALSPLTRPLSEISLKTTTPSLDDLGSSLGVLS